MTVNFTATILSAAPVTRLHIKSALLILRNFGLTQPFLFIWAGNLHCNACFINPSGKYLLSLTACFGILGGNWP